MTRPAKLNRFRKFLRTHGLAIAVADWHICTTDTTVPSKNYVACIVCPQEAEQVVKPYGGTRAYPSTRLVFADKPSRREVLSRFSKWLSRDCDGLRIGNRRVALP